ncbi:MAG: sensor protein [Verrucomicrobiales bacterium]|nr:sensor protein [Verrucomicrobiales bacterium]
MALDIKLLRESETAPPRTTTERTVTITTVSGEWRFFVSTKTMLLGGSLPQWVVFFGGTTLSLLLFQMFSTQSRLRHEAEVARESLLARDTEITGLNRDLEVKITARTAELHEALAEEKELNRLKGNFISMVTHEIRTPLALILGSSEILSRYLDRLPPERRAEHLGTIDSAVARMSALIEDVLLFSRAEAGRMEFNPVPINLKAFTVQLVDELASATNRRCPIELSMRDIELVARGDESLLRHVFANLLTNAAKYSPVGEKIYFSIIREAGDAVFSVRDQGMGIPEEDCKRLFTPFYRGKNAATIQGTGLGLVIVKHCVERHGGVIKVESAEKAGTTVTVRMPLFSPAHTEFLKKLEAENPEPK